MDPFLILLVGIVIVVGGILVLRLHAFLALTLAALAVGALTPTVAVTWFERTQGAGTFVVPAQGAATVGKLLPVEAGGKLLELHYRPGSGQIIGNGAVLYVFSGEPSQRVEQPLAVLRGVDAEGGEDSTAPATALRVVSGEVSAGDMAIGQAAWERAPKTARSTVAERVAEGFGSTCTKIGILIAMAAIIGKCLLESGAADRIIRSALKLVGEARAGLAFLVSGFALGIPVFFDTVFYLMIPLGKALRMRTGRNYLLSILTITAGATMAHSLVPPTPGPLLVAGELGVNLGLMILGGCFVGAFSAAFGYFYAHWINRRVEIPLRDSEDISLAQLEKLAAADESELPPTWLSLLPIVLPVILIGGGTLLDPKVTGVTLGPTAQTLVKTFSNKNVALVISAAVALLTLAWIKRVSRRDLAASVQVALASGGVIILITAAGGAFGGMLKQTGIGERIAELTPTANTLLVLPLAFCITTLVRTAQGSATVAMITAVGILAPLAAATDLGYNNLYLALAIGCGSKPIAWMNDSGFWVICKMSGMTEGETLKTLTPMTASMGVVGLAVTMITAWLLPLT